MARHSHARPSTLCLQENPAQPLLSRKSSSEPDLNTSSKDPHQQLWTSFGRGFPPGMTVDQLAMYRRRRPPCHLRPQDNLHLQGGTLMFLKSEYRKRYVPHPLEESLVRARDRSRVPDTLKLEGDVYLQPEYNEAFVDFPRERPCPNKPRPQLVTGSEPLEAVTVNHSSYVFHKDAQRAKMQRRRTSLRCEGEMAVEQSEVHSKFVLFEGAMRAELARRNTSLRMEGEMDMTTEKNEQYVVFPTPKKIYPSRKQLQSDLKMEGSMEKQTEAKSKYICYSYSEKPTSKRRPTSLRLEGEIVKMTEYLEKFVKHPKGERAELQRRPPNLQLEGEIESRPEYKDFFIDFPRARPVIKKPTDTLKQEGDFEAMTEKRAQFVNFLLNHGTRAEKVRRPNNLKMEGECYFTPEYRDCFICFPCERPQMKKKEDNIKQEGNMELFTEKQSKYVGYPDVHRPELQKRKTNLKLGGNICGNFSGVNNSNVENPQEHDGQSKESDLQSKETDVTKIAPITTQPFDSSSEIRPVYIPKFHENKLAKRPQALTHPGRHTDFSKYPKKYFPPKTGLKESERLLRELLEREKNDGKRKSEASHLSESSRHISRDIQQAVPELAEQRSSPFRAFQVLDVRKLGGDIGSEKQDKSVTFDISDSDKRSSEMDSMEGYRTNSPTFRLMVHPASIGEDHEDYSMRPHNPGVHASPNRFYSPSGIPQVPQEQTNLNVGKSFLVLDDLNNNDVSNDSNGNQHHQVSSRSQSAFLDIPNRKSRRGRVNWMPPWYDAPSSI